MAMSLQYRMVTWSILSLCCQLSTDFHNTAVLSKVFERLVSVSLERVMECSGVLTTTKFAYQKGLGACKALMRVQYTLKGLRERTGVLLCR